MIATSMSRASSLQNQPHFSQRQPHFNKFVTVTLLANPRFNTHLKKPRRTPRSTAFPWLNNMVGTLYVLVLLLRGKYAPTIVSPSLVSSFTTSQPRTFGYPLQDLSRKLQIPRETCMQHPTRRRSFIDHMPDERLDIKLPMPIYVLVNFVC